MRKFNVKVNGTSYQVEIEETNAFATPVAPQEMATAPTAPPKAISTVTPTTAPPMPEKTATPIKSVPSGGTQMTCPMPGTIIKVLVKDGDTVSKGQTVVVLESMKMENDIVAPDSGVVTVSVHEGMNVNSGDLIAVIA